MSFLFGTASPATPPIAKVPDVKTNTPGGFFSLSAAPEDMEPNLAPFSSISRSKQGNTTTNQPPLVRAPAVIVTEPSAPHRREPPPILAPFASLAPYPSTNDVKKPPEYKPPATYVPVIQYAQPARSVPATSGTGQGHFQLRPLPPMQALDSPRNMSPLSIAEEDSMEIDRVDETQGAPLQVSSLQHGFPFRVRSDCYIHMVLFFHIATINILPPPPPPFMCVSTFIYPLSLFSPLLCHTSVVEWLTKQPFTHTLITSFSPPSTVCLPIF